EQKGFTTTLIFFWLDNIDLAKERVKTRVAEGGHNIEPEVIERRYVKGIKYLFDIYLPMVQAGFLFDNSLGVPDIIAQKTRNGNLEIINFAKYAQLKRTYDNN
ncbi:MAG TPA: zeta toxin, partial [Dyadobacter sp.]|nr:zeta toxin [Dyadobacter sp.]